MMRAGLLAAALVVGGFSISTGCKPETYQPDEDEDDGGGSGGPGGGGDDTGGSGSGTGGTDSGTSECADLAPPQCAGTPECQVIAGRPLIPFGAGYCYPTDGEPMALGCMGAGEGCGDAETIAASPEDPSRCFFFSSTCIPEGWSVCGDIGEVVECPPEGGGDGGGTGGGGS